MNGSCRWGGRLLQWHQRRSQAEPGLGWPLPGCRPSRRTRGSLRMRLWLRLWLRLQMRLWMRHLARSPACRPEFVLGLACARSAQGLTRAELGPGLGLLLRPSLQEGAQLVLLGSGREDLESALRCACKRASFATGRACCAALWSAWGQRVVWGEVQGAREEARMDRCRATCMRPRAPALRPAATFMVQRVLVLPLQRDGGPKPAAVQSVGRLQRQDGAPHHRRWAGGQRGGRRVAGSFTAGAAGASLVVCAGLALAPARLCIQLAPARHRQQALTCC